MQELLNNPVFQAAIAPFMIALISGWLLNAVGTRLTGIIIVLGFYLGAVLIMGIQLQPLTSTRKILIIGLVALFIGWLLDRYRLKRPLNIALLSTLGITAALWIAWPLISRKTGMDAWLPAFSGALYASWLLNSTTKLISHNTRAASTLFSLALATSIAALFSASALLAQLTGALAAATGAYLLLNLFYPQQKAGAIMMVPATTLCALLAFSALIYAKLPWQCLIIMAFIPLTTRIPTPQRLKYWQRMGLTLTYSLIPAIISIIFVSRIAQPPPF